MSLHSSAKRNQPDPYHIYMDFSVQNGDTNNKSVGLIFDSTRSSSFLFDPSLYFMSIIRFSLQSTSVPIMLFKPTLNSGNVNEGVYNIKLSFGSTIVTQNITYVPLDANYSAPTVFDVSTYSNLYYQINDYQAWVNMVNSALASAFATLDISEALPTTHAPFVSYDATTSLFSINGDIAGYDSSSGSYISIYFNEPLYSLFSTLNARTFANSDANYGGYKQILLQNSLTNISALPAPASYNIITLTQSSTSIPILNPVTSIVFTSPSFSITQELLNPPIFLNQYGSLGTSGSSSNSTAILTDFEIALSNGNTYKNVIVYDAEVYRLMDIMSNSPMTGFSMSVYWVDPYGAKHIFLLSQLTGATVKIMLRRKSYYQAHSQNFPN